MIHVSTVLDMCKLSFLNLRLSRIDLSPLCFVVALVHEEVPVRRIRREYNLIPNKLALARVFLLSELLLDAVTRLGLGEAVH